MCVVNTAECLSQAENGRQQLHVAYGICGGEYSPFLYLYGLNPTATMMLAIPYNLITAPPK